MHTHLPNMNSNTSATITNGTSAVSHLFQRLLLLPELHMLELLLALFVFIVIRALGQEKRRQGLPAVWPVLGMLPSLVGGIRGGFYDWMSEVLQRQNGTFRFRGPWLSSLHSVITCDPRNLEHLLKTKFSVFPKGRFFRDTVRDLLGDGIFNADDDAWQRQRKTANTEFHSSEFRQLARESVAELVHRRLLPALETAAVKSYSVDLQDLLLRLTFDNVCMIALGVDPGCLRQNLPVIPFARAFEEATEATMLRFMMPTCLWKTMRYLNLGSEKKLKESIKDVDNFAYEAIRKRKQDQSSSKRRRSDLLTVFMRLKDESGKAYSDKFLRDICVNFILAGRDTSSVALSWFFWLLQKNPAAEEKILEEIVRIVRERSSAEEEEEEEEEEDIIFKAEEIKRMEYLQSALSEALRLYPSVPIDHKEVVEDDAFPDGTVLKKGTKVIYAMYAMGRMESIWGKDCTEFKPERWLRDGRFTTESAYLFPAFNGGPRLCIGRDFAYYQMKSAAAAIILRYKVQLVEGHPVEPKLALTLFMKHGLRVNLIKRPINF